MEPVRSFSPNFLSLLLSTLLLREMRAIYRVYLTGKNMKLSNEEIMTTRMGQQWGTLQTAVAARRPGEVAAAVAESVLIARR